jgi:hypothetical protein
MCKLHITRILYDAESPGSSPGIVVTIAVLLNQTLYIMLLKILSRRLNRYLVPEFETNLTIEGEMFGFLQGILRNLF